MLTLPAVTLVFTGNLSGDVVANQARVADALRRLGGAITMASITGQPAKAVLVLDLRAAPALGLAGAGLIYGAYRQAPRGCRIRVISSADVGRSVAFVTRGAVEVMATA